MTMGNNEILTTIRRRKLRKHQQKSRGDKKSYVDIIEDLKMMLAYESGEITEGKLAKCISGGCRVTARGMLVDAKEEGRNIAYEIMRSRQK